MMGAWGKYSNPPSKDSPELQEIKRLHYLWSSANNTRVLPLTFKGEASEELLDFFWEKLWVDKQMRNPVPEEWRLKFPSREGWLAMTAAQLQQIAGQFGLSKSGTKLTLYTKILDNILSNTPSNLYLPLEQLNERVPIFPYSEDAEKISKLYLDTEISYSNFSQILKYTYFTPETFKEIIKWDEKFPDGILDADKDGSMVFGRYFPYYLLSNPHFDLNLLLLRDPAVLYDRHRISAGDNSLAKQLVSGDNTLLKDGDWVKDLLSNNQLLTLELLTTIFADYFTEDVRHSSDFISDSGVKDGLKRMVATKEEWGESLVSNPCFPESLIRFLVQTYPDLLEDALRNPNLSSEFIMEVWSDLTFNQMAILIEHNHFVPRVLIRSLFGIKEDVPKFDSTLTALYMGKWHNSLISASQSERKRFELFNNALLQYHFPLDILKDIRPNTEDNDYLEYIEDTSGSLDAEHLAKNPNPDILEYALDNFPVFLKGGSPRYAIAQNPSLTKRWWADMGNASTVSLLENYYSDFDADDVAKNPALTQDFIEKYWQNGRDQNDKSYTGLSNYTSELTSNLAFFPYDPTPEWASGLFNWRF